MTISEQSYETFSESCVLDMYIIIFCHDVNVKEHNKVVKSLFMLHVYCCRLNVKNMVGNGQRLGMS